MKYIIAPFVFLGLVIGALMVVTVIGFFLVPVVAVVIGTVMAIFGN